VVARFLPQASFDVDRNVESPVSEVCRCVDVIDPPAKTPLYRLRQREIPKRKLPNVRLERAIQLSQSEVNDAVQP